MTVQYRVYFHQFPDIPGSPLIHLDYSTPEAAAMAAYELQAVAVEEELCEPEAMEVSA
jgi:hypothetical protein